MAVRARKNKAGEVIHWQVDYYSVSDDDPPKRVRKREIFYDEAEARRYEAYTRKKERRNKYKQTTIASMPETWPDKMREAFNSLCPYNKLEEYVEPMGTYIYFLMYEGECVYIGQTRHLSSRIAAHRDGSRTTMKKGFSRVFYVEAPRFMEDRVKAERTFIDLLQPHYNKCGIIKGIESPPAIKEYKSRYYGKKRGTSNAKKTGSQENRPDRQAQGNNGSGEDVHEEACAGNRQKV